MKKLSISLLTLSASFIVWASSTQAQVAYPESWKTATPNQLVQIAKNKKFDESTSILLDQLAIQFAQSASPEHVNLLAHEYFLSTSPTVKTQLSMLARNISSPAGLHALEEVLRSTRAKASPPDDPMLKSAAFALWSSGNRMQLESCAEFFITGPSNMRTAFASSLPSSLNPELIPFLSEIVISRTRYAGDPAAVKSAIELLGHIQSDRAATILKTLGQSPDKEESEAATESLERLRLESSTPLQ